MAGEIVFYEPSCLLIAGHGIGGLQPLSADIVARPSPFDEPVKQLFLGRLSPCRGSFKFLVASLRHVPIGN